MPFKKGTKTTQIETVQKETVTTKAAGLTPESVAKKNVSVQLETQKAISEINSKVLELFEQKSTLETDITHKTEHLKTLHDIEVTSTTLDDLKAEIAQVRADWEEERRLYKQTNEREEDTFQYNLKKTRREEADKHALAHSKKESEFAVREADLKGRETKAVENQKAVDGHEAAIEAAKNGARKEGIGIAEKDAKHTAALEKAKTDSDKAVLEGKIAHQSQVLSSTEARNVSLQTELADAHKRNTELAAKVAESYSSRELANNLQRTMEAQNTATGTRK